MSCAPPSKTRVRSWSRPDLSLSLLAASLVLLTSCAGLFQRDIPSTVASCVHESTGALSVGFAEADITPAGEQYLGGFNLGRTSTGVQSKLSARAMVLQVGERKVAIVGVDNLGLQRQDAEWIKSGLLGFANGDVFVCSSHTHAAPDLVGMWGFYFLTSGRDVEYLTRVRNGVIAAVAKADEARRPARLSLGQARLPDRGLVKNSNRKGVFNRSVTALVAKDAQSGAELGALLHFACHPEMLRRQNTLVSSDFPGELCKQWKAAGHGQGVFINGELGAMVTPDFHPRSAEGLPKVGRQLVALFEQACAASEPVDGTHLEIRRRDVYLPLHSPGLVLGRLTGVIRRDVFDGCLRASVGYLRLGAFEAVCVPGEMEPVLADEIRTALQRPKLVFFGLVDDEVGYLMRRQDAGDPEFAYERTMSPGIESGELVRRALVGLTPVRAAASR